MFAGLREYRPPVSANSVSLAKPDGFVQVFRLQHGQHRTKNFLAGDPGVVRHLGKDRRTDEVPVALRHFALEGEA